MTKNNSKSRSGYYLPLTTAAISMFTVVVAATAGGIAGIETGANAVIEKEVILNHSGVDLKNKIDTFMKSFSAHIPQDAAACDLIIDSVHAQRIKFAADHGVYDPGALVAAVNHSSMANLLISVAIEESGGDPVAVGKAGERGAWQVMACDWGSVPKDLYGQAGQAERIIRDLLVSTKGNKIKALAQYNGGTTPPGKSYRYAKRILKRLSHLQVNADYHSHNFSKLRTALLIPPGNSRMLTSFFNAGVTSNTTNLLS